MEPNTESIEEPRRGGWRNRRGWVVAGVLIALAWTVPALSQTTLTWTTFSPGTPARASEINANFEILRGRLEMAETRLAAAESNITALQMRDDFVPPGTIAFFAGTECPTGWGPYEAANGRYVVAVTDGTAGYAVGDALDDHEVRTHTHTIAHRHPWLRAEDGDKAYYSYTSSIPGSPEVEVRDWDGRIGGDGSRWPFTYERDGTLYTGDTAQPNSGEASDGEIAPYIQLRACTKS